MKKLKLSLAAFIVTLAISSCGGGEDGGILAGGADTPQTPPAGKTETAIVVTFKNGWEDAPEAELKDDSYTAFEIHKKMTLEKVNAVVNTDELKAYEAAHEIWKEVKAKWDAYYKELAEYQANEDTTSPPPP
ncbi:MAG: hypothetical protein LBC27_02350, partial [Spirochaetaceae bacterium]|nr:hypothetical protein [Spirochaetaceae bacterium]